MKLHELINPDLRLEMIVKISSQEIDLQETNVNEENKDKTLQSVKIKDLPLENVFAFSLDNEKARNYFLNKFQPHITKYCDFILFLYEENTAKIVFCELKSERGSGYEIQWLNTRLFVEYLRTLLKNHFEIEIEIDFFYLLFQYKPQRPILSSKSFKGNANQYHFEAYLGSKVINYSQYFKCFVPKTHHNHIPWQEIISNYLGKNV